MATETSSGSYHPAQVDVPDDAYLHLSNAINEEAITTMSKRHFTAVTLLTLVSLLLLGCDNTSSAGSGSGTSAAVTNSAAAAPTAKSLRKIHLVMGYIPSPQFAAYYMATEKGYYRDAGLDVDFDYAQVTDALSLTAQGWDDFAITNGDEVLVARAAQVPVVYVMTQYQRYPIVVFSRAEKNITKPADLVGKKVGIPGHYGSIYIAVKAMLYANHIAEKDVNLIDIGYTQVQSITNSTVDAAVGYSMNEPIALQQQGVKINVIQTADQYNLASAGIVTSQKLIDSEPATVQAFVQASVKGLDDVNRDPAAAFAVVGKYVKEVTDPANSAYEKASLSEIIKFQTPSGGVGVGQADAKVWAATEKFLLDSGTTSTAIDPNKAFTNQFVPAPN